MLLGGQRCAWIYADSFVRQNGDTIQLPKLSGHPEANSQFKVNIAASNVLARYLVPRGISKQYDGQFLYSPELIVQQ